MLPAPIIQGTLPAFYYSGDEKCAKLHIPFSMSRAVHQSEIKGFRLKIKNIQGGDYIATLDSTEVDYVNNEVIFSLFLFTDVYKKKEFTEEEFNKNKEILYIKNDEGKYILATNEYDSAKTYYIKEIEENKNFHVGSFYKAQLAYIGSDKAIGFYSTVGIIKYTTKPIVSIIDLKTSNNNSHKYEYTGKYSQEGQDFTEKEYSYRFVVKDPDGIVIEDTGYVIHNNSKDENAYESSDSFLLSKDLEINKKYSIQYSVKTNNGLEIHGPNYKLVMNRAVSSVLKADLIAELNYANGYVKLSLNGEKDDLGIETSIKGLFVLSRSSEKTDFTQWEELERFAFAYEKPSSKSWKDFTIEQGVKYKYSIQQYNRESLYSERIVSNSVYADFEDSFLYDGEKQLKIRFNPKVSSFKKDLLESKADTIGSKYPFIFRNGKVEYKEFPISGLISYLSDEESLFFNTQSLFSNRERKLEKEYIKKDFPVSFIMTPKIFYSEYLGYYYYYNSTYIRWIDYLKIDPPGKNFVYSKSEWYHDGEWYWPGNGEIEEYFNRDKDKLFVIKTPQQELNRFNENLEKLKTTNELSYNIQIERDFKLQVLDWLTNGKPKLFKSPTEGNYLVRLMNTSLSPSDQLGRMLHTFSCTAYEIADISYETLVQYNIINVIAEEQNKYLKISSIPLATMDTNFINLNSHINYVLDTDSGYYYATGNILKAGQNIEWANIVDMDPNSLIKIDGEEIIVGGSGSYNIYTNAASIIIPENIKSHGIITIAYYGLLNDSFSQISSVDIKEIVGKQVIGPNQSVLTALEDIIKRTSTIYNIKLNRRPEIEIFIDTKPSTYEPADIGTHKDYDKYLDQLYHYIQEEDIYEKVSIEDEYDETEIYYKAVYQINASNGNIIGRYDNGVVSFNEEYQECELNIYKYSTDYLPELAMPFYKKIEFTNTNIRDESIADKTTIRYPKNRTVTNSKLMDIRDFYLYANAGKLYILKENLIKPFSLEEDTYDSSMTYFILQDKIEIYWDKYNSSKYLEENDYNNLLSIFQYLENGDQYSATLKRYYGIYSHKSIIKNIYDTEYIDIDLQNRASFETGPIEASLLKIPNGIYCELFYQEQNLNYDFNGNASLIQKKQLLDQAREKLSKEYMIYQCFDRDNSVNYLKDIKNVYNTYLANYNAYRAELTLYLQSLEEG